MTNRANLARQLVAYALAHPETGAPLLEFLAATALYRPGGPPTAAIASLIPDPESTMGAALVASLNTFAHELRTAPLSLGEK
jgi:hypothetical protein